MLDTKGRKIAQPILDAIVHACHRVGIGAAVANRPVKSFHYAP